MGSRLRSHLRAGRRPRQAPDGRRPAGHLDARRDHFRSQNSITGTELFEHVLALINQSGWAHGVRHAGHLVGEFPHERINGDEIDCYITRGNDGPMRRLDAAGKPCHWILEVHLMDRDRGFGAFHEQLLDI